MLNDLTFTDRNPGVHNVSLSQYFQTLLFFFTFYTINVSNNFLVSCN